MMFVSSFVLILVLAVSMVKAAALPEEEEPDVHSLGYANNYFGVNLHKKLSSSLSGNVFFSPFAVSSALAMLYKGAQNDTAKELRSVLGYYYLDDPTVFSAYKHYLANVLGKMNPKIYTVNFLSALIVDSSFPLRPLYKHQMQDVFQAYVLDANLEKNNLAIVRKLNTWAKIQTKGAIDNLADRIDPDASMFLTSAAYFKGAWKVKFDPEDTKHHLFYNRGLKSNAKEIPMMHSYASVRYFEDEEADFTAVELFYEGRDISMVIYLPKKIDGLQEFIAKMTPARLSCAHRQMYYQKVHITMPKFKLEMEQSLSTSLKELGLLKIFNFGADLSGIAPEVSLVLDDVKHKAQIEVNEKGSIAAAITRIIMTKSMPLPIPDPEFKVDHPFLFTIFDNRSNMILFMGSANEL